MNKSYLARIFKEVNGQTVHQHLNQQRLIQSQRLLLLFPDYRIEEIASMYGFSSSSYFIKQIKESFIVTPKQYRQRSNSDIFQKTVLVEV